MNWNDLTMAERAKLIKTYVNNGVYDISEMKEHYNSLTPPSGPNNSVSQYKPPYDQWYQTVPEDRNDTTDYNLRRAFDLASMRQLEQWRKARVEELQQGKKHLNSVYKNSQTGEYEFMKSKYHPTVQYELDWYNSNDPEAVKFRQNYSLDTTGTYYKYVPKKYAYGGDTAPTVPPGLFGGMAGAKVGGLAALLTRPVDLNLMANRNNTVGNNRKLNMDNMAAIDNYMISKGVPLYQRQALLYTILQESGADTLGAHGNGYYGLVGWSADRYNAIKDKSLLGQAEYLYNTLYNGNGTSDWNHGGTGSGYNSWTDAKEAFTTAQDFDTAMKALTYGYVRPAAEVKAYRLSNGLNHFNNQMAYGGPKDPPKKSYNLDLSKYLMPQPGSEEFNAKFYGQTIPVDNTRTVNSTPQSSEEYIKMQQIKKQKEAAAKEAQRRKEEMSRPGYAEINAAQLPQNYKSYYTNPAKEGWDSEAANFGYALGAGHDMTLQEVNDWNLNVTQLPSYLIAPGAASALTVAYYSSTKRPEEAALSALFAPLPGKGIIYSINKAALDRVFPKTKESIKNTFLNNAYNPKSNIIVEHRTPVQDIIDRDIKDQVRNINNLDKKIQYTVSPIDYISTSYKTNGLKGVLSDLTKNRAYASNNKVHFNPLELLKRHDNNFWSFLSGHEVTHPYQNLYINPSTITEEEALFGKKIGLKGYDVFNEGNTEYFVPNPRNEYISQYVNDFMSSEMPWYRSPNELQADMLGLKLKYGIKPHKKYNSLSTKEKELLRSGLNKEGWWRISDNNDNFLKMLEDFSKAGYFAIGGKLK